MFCSISGQVPQEPVISSTGYLFERALVCDEIARTGNCPVSGEPLSEQDLTRVKVNAFARPPAPAQEASVPALLASLQQEWRAGAVQTFELRKQVADLKQQLSAALYREDAGKRVIARLLQERDEARAGAASGHQQQQQQGAEEEHGGAEPMQMEEDAGLSPQLAASLGEAATSLSAARKSRAVAAELASGDSLETYKAVESMQPHGNAKNSSVTTLHAHHKFPSRLISGASDGNVALFSVDSDAAPDIVKTGSKRVNSALFLHGEDAFASSCGSDVSVFRKAGAKYQKAASFDAHSAVVFNIDVHPTLDVIFTSSKDNTWALHDVTSGATVYAAGLDNGDDKGITGAALHGDGLLYGTCAGDGVARLWDVRSRANVLTFADNAHAKPGTAMAFSENGYVLATGAADGSIHLFDLRQLKGTPLFATLDAKKSVEKLAFDYSGTYLAAAGKDLSIFKLDDVDVSSLVTLKGHSKKVTGVAFGPNASFIASSSLDKTVKVWKPPQ